MAYPSVTHTFTNSTTADAPQVNTNFTDLINGASDATKDYSINALTCAGAATLNGNVTLGNATGDDITITGSIAASIPIKTTFSYDLGTATIGWKSIYFGDSGSAARTTRVIGAAVASSWTLTLPTGAGTDNYVMETNGSGTTSWTSRTKMAVATKTANYTLTSNDELILCNTNAFTVTLPAANAITGKIYEVRKIGSDSNSITIARAGSDTIEGATSYVLYGQYDALRLISDGSATWYILKGSYTRQYTVGALQTTAGTTTSATFAAFSNTASLTFTARRSGDYIIWGTFIGASDTAGVETSMTVKNTAGSATLIREQPSRFDATNVNYSRSFNPWALFTLTAGTSYTFQVYGQVGGGATFTMQNTLNTGQCLMSMELQ